MSSKKEEAKKAKEQIEEESEDERFADLDEEETGPPVDMYGRLTKFAENYVSSSDEEFPDEFKKYENSESEPDILTKESTKRLAITGLNWKKMTATDIFACIYYSLDKKETLQNITVYLSHYGEEHQNDFKDTDIPEDQPDDVRAAAWRHRQHVESKFYFAIAEFSDEKAADDAYKELSNCEFGDSGNFMELSVVPDETDFSDMKVRDTAKDIPEDWDMPNIVMPWQNQTKAEDDWEVNPPEREAAVQACWDKDINDEELEEVASTLLGDGSEDDERPERKDLLGTLDLLREAEEADKENEEEELEEIEFSFISHAGKDEKKDKKKKKKGKEEDVEEANEEEDQEEEQKKAEKKKKKKQKKDKKQEEQDDTELVNDILKDDRFNEVFNDSGYGIDASAANYKKDPAMDKLSNMIAIQHQNKHRKL